jgi:hypothetical protein
MYAHIIYVINKGKIEESGKFHELKRYKDYKAEGDFTREAQKIK